MFVINLVQKPAVFFKYLTNIAISNRETVAIVTRRFSHNWTVTIVPQWHCYDCSTVTSLRFFHKWTVTTVPQWHCYDAPQWHCCHCSLVALLRLLHGDTLTIVPQWHCCDCSIVTLLRLFHSDTVTIVPQWHCWPMIYSLTSFKRIEIFSGVDTKTIILLARL